MYKACKLLGLLLRLLLSRHLLLGKWIWCNVIFKALSFLRYTMALLIRKWFFSDYPTGWTLNHFLVIFITSTFGVWSKLIIDLGLCLVINGYNWFRFAFGAILHHKGVMTLISPYDMIILTLSAHTSNKWWFIFHCLLNIACILYRLIHYNISLRI